MIVWSLLSEVQFLHLLWKTRGLLVFLINIWDTLDTLRIYYKNVQTDRMIFKKLNLTKDLLLSCKSKTPQFNHQVLSFHTQTQSQSNLLISVPLFFLYFFPIRCPTISTFPFLFFCTWRKDSSTFYWCWYCQQSVISFFEFQYYPISFVPFSNSRLELSIPMEDFLELKFLCPEQ